MKVARGEATTAAARDTGMAAVLILLIVLTVRGQLIWGMAAAVVQVVNMTAPQVFRPLAVVWLGLSHVLGLVVSKLILAIIFFVVVTPVAIVRRIVGADSLHLRGFKRGHGSVMRQRDHTFSGKDLEQPY
jgi:hypothetical protein